MNRHSEYRVVALIAKRNLEKLLKILTNHDLDDYFFQDIIKKLVNYWLRSLFTNFLNREDCLWIWDLGLALGFDFYIKTCVYLLKSYENSLKIRIKSLKERPNPEVLFKIAHEEVRKVMAKGISVKIKTLVQECFDKKMRLIVRQDLINSAKILEINESRQIIRINQCRKILNETNFGLKEFEVFVDYIKKHDGNKIYRENFVRILIIAQKDLSEFGDFLYNLLDVEMNGWIFKEFICNNFAVFLNYWEDRIEKIFFCLNSKDLRLQDFIKIIQNIEQMLDKRSADFTQNEKILIRNLQDKYGEILSKQEVFYILKNDQLFKKFMELLIDEKLKVLSTADSITEINTHPDPPITANPNPLLSPDPYETPSISISSPANSPHPPPFLLDLPAHHPPILPSNLASRKCLDCSSCTII